MFYLPQQSRHSWEYVCLSPEHTYNAEEIRGLILLKPIPYGEKVCLYFFAMAQRTGSSKRTGVSSLVLEGKTVSRNMLLGLNMDENGHKGPGILKCSQWTSSWSFFGAFLKYNPTLTESKFQKPGYCRTKSYDLEITSAVLITNFYISEFPEHHRQPEWCHSSCSNPAACSDWGKGDIQPVNRIERYKIIWNHY